MTMFVGWFRPRFIGFDRGNLSASPSVSELSDSVTFNASFDDKSYCTLVCSSDNPFPSQICLVRTYIPPDLGPAYPRFASSRN